VVKDVEHGEINGAAAHRKYGIGGKASVMRWVKQYGSGKYGKVIRVEEAREIDEERRLRQEVRKLKEALADAHVDLALANAFLERACEEMEQSPEAFKKKHAGGRRMRR
jgi:transposase-like protein